jgi:hypothetical protein
MKLFIWFIPILLISIFLSLYLKTSLIIISGLLFCYLVYAVKRPGSIENFSPESKKLFSLAIFFTLVSKILFYLKDIYLTHGTLSEALNRPIMPYKICSLSASYQTFGFIKRGLLPTIVNLISPDYIIQIYSVQLMGLGIIIAGLLLINIRKEFSIVHKGIFLAVILLSPIGIYPYFNFYLGFYDMALIGLLLISISYNNRPASVFVDIAGLLVHEAYIFLRFPFLIFQLFSLINRKKPYASVLVSIFINSMVFFLIIQSPRPGFDELKENYFSHYSSLKSITSPGDMEAFLPLCKEGTLASNFKIIQQFYFTGKAASLYIPITVSIISIALLGFFTNTISGKNRVLDVMASLFAFVFPLTLCLVGGDFGRWLAFSYVLWAIYYFLFRPKLFSGAQLSFKYLYGVLLVALIFSPFGANYNPLFYTLMGN